MPPSKRNLGVLLLNVGESNFMKILDDLHGKAQVPAIRSCKRSLDETVKRIEGMVLSSCAILGVNKRYDLVDFNPPSRFEGPSLC